MAVIDILKKGSTDRSITLKIIDSTTGLAEEAVEHNTSGIALWYRREGAAKTAITPAALTALTDAHSDGGIEHVDDGDYRLDIPDAAFASGANYVDFGGTVTGMIVIGGRVKLVNYDPEDTVRLGLTALPNAAANAANGLITSTAGSLDIDTVASNVAAILVDTGTDIPNALVTIDTVVDSILVDTGTDIPTLINTVDTVVDAILVDTAEIGAAGAGLTAIPWNAAWDTEVQSEVNDGLVAFFTSAAALVDLIWDEATSGHSTAGTTGKALTDAGSAGDPWSTALPGAYSAGSAGYIIGNLSVPTVGAIADGVWDELIAGHAISGSTGEALSAAGGAGDPWITSLPGSYTGTQAGKILADILTDTGTTLDGKIDTIDGIVDSILADTGTDGVVVASGSKTGYSLTATTGLGNQTADITGSLSGSVGSVTGAVGSVTGNVGGNVAGSVGSVLGGINTTAGVITTLDALDTAQDSQHGTTQAAIPTVGAIADGVWDEDIDPGHIVAGSAGELLNSSGGGSSPTTIAAAVWDTARSPDHTTAGTFGYYLDAQVSGVSGSGAGLYTVTVTVANSSGDALQGARVNIDGTDQTLTTPTDGIVTFNLDAGSYSLVVSPPAGYQTPANTSLTVSADASTTITLTAGSSGVGWLG